MRTEVFILLPKNTKAKTGLEEAVVNQTTVWPESGADRAAANRENPVLFTAPLRDLDIDIISGSFLLRFFGVAMQNLLYYPLELVFDGK